ncbi:glycosyltransferase [Aeromonas veronii]
MKKNKVLLLLDHCLGGGVEKFIQTLHSADISKNSVKVISLFKPITPLKLNSDCSFEYVFNETSEFAIKMARAFLSDEILKYDLIIVSHPKMTKVMSHFENSSIVYVCHGFSKEFYSNIFNKIRYYYFLRRVYKNKKLVCVSHGLEQVIKKIVPTCTSCTIHNPIDHQGILALAEEYTYKHNDYYVYVGRLSKEKNVNKIISDFYVSKAYLNHKLVIVGDGCERDEIKKLINKLNLDGKVIMEGYLVNPYPVIKKARALVLSSDREGFGYVIAEALLLKTPVISVDCDFGPRDLIVGGNKMFLKKMDECLFKDVNPNSFSFDEFSVSMLEPAIVIERYASFKNI